MALGGYYSCSGCGSRRDSISPPEKITDGDKQYERFYVIYDCGSRMIIYRDGVNWKIIGFEHKCNNTGGILR